MNEFIKNLIAQYKNATEQIPVLKSIIENSIESEDANTVIAKANIVNLTIALRGFRLIEEGVRNFLGNADYVIDEDGIYKKLNDNDLNDNSDKDLDSLRKKDK